MANCDVTSVGFTPLTDLGVSPYPGVLLGLYPEGSNEMPGAHLAAGASLATAVRPRKTNGQTHPNGKIGLLSIGMSNTRDEFAALMAQGPAPNPKVALVNGAQKGMAGEAWSNPESECWARLDTAITNAGLTNLQMAVAWVKLATASPSGGWPDAKDVLQAQIELTLRELPLRFPYLTMVYLSSRVYGGYADAGEPFAYDGGFAVRGVIEKQLVGLLPYAGPERVVPWLAWGPYLWADGLIPRSDGLIWPCEDFKPDGIHPDPSGQAKVATMLRDFFMIHPTTMPWFLGNARTQERR